METIVITSKEPFRLEQFRHALSKRWRVEATPAGLSDPFGGLVVNGPKTRVFIHTDIGGDECRVLLDYRYSDVELIKAVLEIIADDPGTEISADFGLTLPGNEFVARCKADKDWDWRQ